jgi:hypothetical protein
VTATQIPPELDTPEFRVAFNEFLADRAAKKIKNTDLAVTKLLNKMKPWGPKLAIQAMSNAIERGWRGVFKPDGAMDMAATMLTREPSLDPLYTFKLRALDDLAFCGYLTEETQKRIVKAGTFVEVAELKAVEFRKHEKEIQEWPDHHLQSQV